MIPKTIHYCWFGRGKKPEIFEKCLQSWKKFAPDYEIVEWNEDNFDVSRFPFAQEAYDCKKYAFVSDIVRLSIIYEHGGVYLDTDVELIASIDNFLEDDCFLFFQNVVQIATGLGFGAIQRNPIIGKMLDDYVNRHFSIEKMASVTCPKLNTLVLTQEVPTLIINNTTQYVNGIHCYSSQVYDSCAVHHDQFSWMNEEHRKALRYARKTPPNRKILKHFRNPRIFDWFDRHQLLILKRLYLFAVYDFVEYGAIYWCYKVTQRVSRKLASCTRAGGTHDS